MIFLGIPVCIPPITNVVTTMSTTMPTQNMWDPPATINEDSVSQIVSQTHEFDRTFNRINNSPLLTERKPLQAHTKVSVYNIFYDRAPS